MRYVLNSAVLSSPGLYSYTLISQSEARAWWVSGPEPISAIGYPETAQTLGQILDVEVRANRITITMQPGDEALVFRPLGGQRVPPEKKGQLGNVNDWELGLLKRVQ